MKHLLIFFVLATATGTIFGQELPATLQKHNVLFYWDDTPIDSSTNITSTNSIYTDITAVDIDTILLLQAYQDFQSEQNTTKKGIKKFSSDYQKFTVAYEKYLKHYQPFFEDTLYQEVLDKNLFAIKTEVDKIYTTLQTTGTGVDDENLWYIGMTITSITKIITTRTIDGIHLEVALNYLYMDFDSAF